VVMALFKAATPTLDLPFAAINDRIAKKIA
jgi:hypothetical protein